MWNISVHGSLGLKFLPNLKSARRLRKAAAVGVDWQGRADRPQGAVLGPAPAPGGPGVGLRLAGVSLSDLRQGGAAARCLAGGGHRGAALRGADLRRGGAGEGVFEKSFTESGCGTV